MTRRDYTFPFRIDPGSRQAALTPYETHVDQMIRQILLTSPGERADFPDFGCGLRQIVFAPHSEALDATTNLLVLKALNKWLGDQIQVQKVLITPSGQGFDDSQFIVQINYTLIETRTPSSTEVLILS